MKSKRYKKLPEKTKDLNPTPIDKLLSELKKKINGYKSQDIKKKRFNIDTFIKYDELIEKLLRSKLKCKYCFTNLLLMLFFSRISDWFNFIDDFTLLYP